ncbi:MAG TPA: XRE family transcriptional regulator [Allosphingosinicella sp.]|jgi:Zn-dependent peptidase ImmA (M78 family)
MRSAKVFAVPGGFVPARLTIARQAKGLKQKDLAEELRFTAGTISKWESESYEQGPDPSSLQALADRLSVAPSWFYKPLRDGHAGPAFYRSMRSELTTAREKAAAKLLFSYEIHRALDDVVEFPVADVPDLAAGTDYRTLSTEKIEALADRLREYWGLGDDPISDLMVVMENAGIVVAETYLDSNKLDGVSAWFADSPVVLLAKDKDGGVRRRFDAAHELGHLVLHRGLTQDCVKNDLRLIEEQAMLFAGAFLLPASSFAVTSDRATLEHLCDIKPRWGVSVGAMIKRLASLNLISENHERNLWKYYSYRQWRGNEPHDDRITVERPDNLRAALELLSKEDPVTLSNVVESVSIGPEYISELTGIECASLNAPAARRPKLKLVRTDVDLHPAND